MMSAVSMQHRVPPHQWRCCAPQFGQLGLGRARPDAHVPEKVQLLDDAKVVDVAAGVRN